MCKIITIINKNPANNEVIKQVIQGNSEALKMERNGYSVLRNGEASYHLPSEYGAFAENVEYNGEEMFCIHTRTSTGGDSDTKGLHLKNVDGWFWAHNGTVSHFMGVKDYNDSHYFFNSLLQRLEGEEYDNPIGKEAIEKACKDFGFNGKGFLYNHDKKIFQWFCNSFSYIYLLEGTVIITTWDMSTKMYEYDIKNILGFEYYTNVREFTIPFLHTEKIDDTMLTMVDFELIGREKISTRGYTGGYYNRYNQGATEIKSPSTNTNSIDYRGLTKKERKILNRANKALKNAGEDVIIFDSQGNIVKDDNASLLDKYGEYKFRGHEIKEVE